MMQSVRGLPCGMQFLLEFINAEVCQFSGYVLVPTVLSFPCVEMMKTGVEKNLTVLLYIYIGAAEDSN